MGILNYTTKIDSYKTITEIQKLLASKDATKIVIDNDINGQPIALTFCIDWHGPIAFVLPCNYEGVLKAMQKDRKVSRVFCNKEQALRVSWRILKDWIQAQIAIVDVGLAQTQEAFLPYAITKSGQTLYNSLEKDSGILKIAN